MQVLYGKLPGKEIRVIPGKKVAAVEQINAGVNVLCADDSVFKGDVLVGSDGVHSTIRHLALESPMTGSYDKKPSTAINLTAKHNCLFVTGPALDGITSCNITELHDNGITFQMVATSASSYSTMRNPKDPPVVRRCTAEDAEALAVEYADHLISWGDKLKSKDPRIANDSANMYDLEEGVAKKWYGRLPVSKG